MSSGAIWKRSTGASLVARPNIRSRASRSTLANSAPWNDEAKAIAFEEGRVVGEKIGDGFEFGERNRAAVFGYVELQLLVMAQNHRTDVVFSLNINPRRCRAC